MGEAVAEPVLVHPALVELADAVTLPVEFTTVLAVALHPLLVIVTVYVPGDKLDAVALVAPLLQI